MLVMLRVAAPVFIKVTDCGALVVPTSWFPKVNEVGERLAPGAAPFQIPLVNLIAPPVRLYACPAADTPLNCASTFELFLTSRIPLKLQEL